MESLNGHKTEKQDNSELLRLQDLLCLTGARAVTGINQALKALNVGIVTCSAVITNPKAIGSTRR